MGPKKFLGSKIILGPKKFLGSKILMGPKNYGSKKIVGPTTFESEKYLESKIFGLVGMGVLFLGFRVAYIPNLSLLQSLEPFEK